RHAGDPLEFHPLAAQAPRPTPYLLCRDSLGALASVSSRSFYPTFVCLSVVSDYTADRVATVLKHRRGHHGTDDSHGRIHHWPGAKAFRIPVPLHVLDNAWFDAD